MKNQVHVAIQIVPISNHPLYPIIDKAIEVISKSGISYRVGAMETVLQGEYNAIMETIREAEQACLDNGADEIVVTIKVHARRNAPVTWEEKGL